MVSFIEPNNPNSDGLQPNSDGIQVVSFIVDKEQVGLDRQPDAIFDTRLQQQLFNSSSFQTSHLTGECKAIAMQGFARKLNAFTTVRRCSAHLKESLIWIYLEPGVLLLANIHVLTSQTAMCRKASKPLASTRSIVDSNQHVTRSP